MSRWTRSVDSGLTAGTGQLRGGRSREIGAHGGRDCRLGPMDGKSADHNEGSTMTGPSTAEPHELWPQDTLTRAAAVFEFITGHVLVQEELDPDPDRDVAPWIGLIGGHVGRAAGVVAE